MEIGCLLKNIGQIFAWLQSVFLCGFNDGIDPRAGFGASGSVGEQLVFAANDKGLDAALRPIVRDFQSAIQQIAFKIFPL